MSNESNNENINPESQGTLEDNADLHGESVKPMPDKGDGKRSDDDSDKGGDQ